MPRRRLKADSRGLKKSRGWRWLWIPQRRIAILGGEGWVTPPCAEKKLKYKKKRLERHREIQIGDPRWDVRLQATPFIFFYYTGSHKSNHLRLLHVILTVPLNSMAQYNNCHQYYFHQLANIYHNHRSQSPDYNQCIHLLNYTQHDSMLESSQSPDSSPPPSAHSVKVEPEDPDSRFIMELSPISPTFGLSLAGANQALAPPTQVPLRATQASKEMRKMMGVFRLNPFAMHTGEGRGVMPPPWYGGGPLEEEPLIFEFQLDILQDDLPDYPAIPTGSSGSPTDSLLGPEEEAQLRSFSPSFELHPEDLTSDMGEEPDTQNEWSDPDYGNQSEVDTSSTTHSVHTPSETRSAHTPFNDPSVFQYPTPPPAVSTWDIESYQAQGEEHLPHAENLEGGHKMHRVHTSTYLQFLVKSSQNYQHRLATSHPYLRMNQLNHQASPSSSTHSLSQSQQPHLHTQPELNFAYPQVLQQPTTHHQHQHYNHQVPSQSHSHSYSFHESIPVSAPLSGLELIPAQDSSMYMRSGRSLKLAQDETSSSNLHHHPAGIVNEYIPRGTASTYTGQHDTHSTSGHHYEVTFFNCIFRLFLTKFAHIYYL